VLAPPRRREHYKDAMLGSLRPLQTSCTPRSSGASNPEDATVPYRDRGYWYYSRYERAPSTRACHAGQTPPVRPRGDARRQRDGRGRDFYEIAGFE